MMMMDRYQVSFALVLVLLLQGCTHPGLQQQSLRQGVPAVGASPSLLAVYEPWFGHPRHISVGYSSQDPAVIQKQIDQAKTIGISWLRSGLVRRPRTTSRSRLLPDANNCIRKELPRGHDV